MSNWPISLGLGPAGPAAFFAYGLGAGTQSGGSSMPPTTYNQARAIIPVFLSGYAGRDFPPLSSAADDVFAIDLSPALDNGDSLIAGSLETLFFPVDIPVVNYAAALDGPPGLVGAIAVQAITEPAAARYLLGFTCSTANGRRVQLHSFFTAMGIPDAA